MLRDKISGCLAARGGQFSARAHAAELGKAYLSLNDEGKRKYLKLLVDEFNVDRNAVRNTAEQLFTDVDTDQRYRIEQELRNHLTPPYLTLLTQFNALPRGIKFLVDMRSDLLRLQEDHPELRPINLELKKQLSSWFDIGFLELTQINWNSPAAILEKVIAHDPVHKLDCWSDIQARLTGDNRCFAFFHPRMPDDPLIFVWVTLITELAAKIEPLLATGHNHTDKPVNTAIFYSINTTQHGLSGIPLGDFLIRRATQQLLVELPQLEMFSTLSPIPGFASWLKEHTATTGDALLTEAELTSLASSGRSFDSLLQKIDWLDELRIAEPLQPILLRLAANYICKERNQQNRAIDKVAHFHLSNGATVERINWLADTSEQGKSLSLTLMVNYRYNLDSIEINHQLYTDQGIAATSKAVEALLQ